MIDYDARWSREDYTRRTTNVTEMPSLRIVAIRYGSPDRKVKEKRMEDTFRSLDRGIISFFLAYAGLTYTNAILLPEETHLQALFTAGPMMIMAIAIRFHWNK